MLPSIDYVLYKCENKKMNICVYIHIFLVILNKHLYLIFMYSKNLLNCKCGAEKIIDRENIF